MFNITMIPNDKSTKKVKDTARALVMDFLMNTLTEILTDDRVSRISNTEIAFSIADTTLDTGEIVEIPFIIKPVAKDFSSGMTTTGKEREAFDRVKTAEIYEEECEQKKIEAERKAAEKAKKIAKDKARREKAKGE